MKLKELFAPKEYTLENGTTVKEPRSKVIFITILLLIAMYFAGKITGFNLKTLMTRGGQFFVISVKCSHQIGNTQVLSGIH